mgnify:FL=1
MITSHKVWRVGAGIDTDALAPGAYMKLELKDIAQHCLESRYPGLAQSISEGDILVAGPDFGIGSSREQAVGVLLELGIKAVIAPSFSGLYFRNAFNLGLLAVTCPDAELIAQGSLVHIDTDKAVINVQAPPMKADAVISRPQQGNSDSGPAISIFPCQKIPGFLLDMVSAGGLLNQLEQRYLAQRT